MMFYLGCDDLRVQRSADLVYIATVGAGMGDDDLAAKIRKELWSHRRRSSVRAVDDNATSIEREPENGIEQKANILGAICFVDRRRNGLLRTRRQTCELAEYLLFYSEFHSVGKFIAIWAK